MQCLALVITHSGDGYHTQQENAVSVFNTATVNGLHQEGLLLPTREELGARAFDTIRFWMEEGHSQLLSREQLLQIASWALNNAGYGPNPGHDLIDLPEDFPR